MGQSLMMKLFFDNSCHKEVKVVMLGLDAAGKTTDPVPAARRRSAVDGADDR
ncbi:hypothetical protein PVAP13_4KG397900 [Panicum virgatum]|uniref:ADP-ribosylation factor n=1 Tax=Panicum virgatum TaxID=38727 RepID=A0A8T0TSE8_PANVG|nr:hypothetical protein PVAP13_4KG397900 [Panicum virgatum]